MRSLNQLRPLRNALIACRRRLLARGGGVRIHPRASVSLSSKILGTRANPVEIGEASLVAFKVLIVTQLADGRSGAIRVGRNCFIGGGAVLLPGVTVNDEAIVAAGAVVFDDVPRRCVVAGNPARILQTDIAVGEFGRFDFAHLNAQKYYEQE